MPTQYNNRQNVAAVDSVGNRTILKSEENGYRKRAAAQKNHAREKSKSPCSVKFK